MPADFSANVERFTGFAPIYNECRPSPPALLAGLLSRFAQTEHLGCVVDLGAGTGLSTRYWEGKADRIVGIEPSDSMRRQAEDVPSAAISYIPGYSHATGLPDHCAQIVTCSQSLHWMDPKGTFREAARILQPGGVFAAYDYDWPPSTGNWHADAAFENCLDTIRRLETEHHIVESVHRWEKSGHLSRMRESGCFRYAREVLLHHQDEGTSDRLAGLLLSLGSARSLLKLGLSERELGIEKLRTEAERYLGSEPKVWHWSLRIRVGIT